MDEDTLLELLAEYSGDWKERQYREHIMREIQKKEHLAQLISEHFHDKQDQLMLEASKRKTVIEIEKKFQVSEINRTYVFPLKKRQGRSPGSASATGELSQEEDSYNNSLDGELYNLKAQNVSRKKKKVIYTNELSKMHQPKQQNNLNAQPNNEANLSSSLTYPATMQLSSSAAAPVKSGSKGDTIIMNQRGQEMGNSENLYRARKEDAMSEENNTSKIVRTFLNSSSENTEQNQLSIKNTSSSQMNLQTKILSPNKQQIGKILDQSSPGAPIGGGINSSQVKNQKIGVNNNISPDKQKMGAFIQSQQQSQQQIQMQQQQQSLLKYSQEDASMKGKNQQQSSLKRSDRLNTCDNQISEKDDPLFKLQQQQPQKITKSTSNSPMAKNNGYPLSQNNNFYQNNAQQIISTGNNNNNKNNNNNWQNNQIVNKSEVMQKGPHTLSLANNLSLAHTPSSAQTNTLSSAMAQKLSNSSGGNTSSMGMLQKGNSKEASKHSNNTLETILQRQQQQLHKYTAESAVSYVQPSHQILTTQESNFNDISIHDSAPKISFNPQQQSASNSQNSKKLYQLNGNSNILNSSNTIQQPYQQASQLQQSQNLSSSQQYMQGYQQYSQGYHQYQQIQPQLQLQHYQQELSSQQQQQQMQIQQLHQLQQQQQQQQQHSQPQQLNMVNQSGSPIHVSISNNKQRKLVHPNGISSSNHNALGGNNVSQSLVTSNSQLNIGMPSASQINLNTNSTDNSSMQHTLDNKYTMQNGITQSSNMNPQGGYANDRLLASKLYKEHQEVGPNPLFHNNDDILSAKSNGIDSQRKSTVRSKKSGGVTNQNPEDMDSSSRLSSQNQALNGVNSLQFSQTHSSYKNKWIDFKKLNQYSKEPDKRTSGGAINQTQVEEPNQSLAQNVRNTYNSMSPNGHLNANKKGSSHLNNYLSQTSAILNQSNSPSLGKGKQAVNGSLTQSGHYSNSHLVATQSSLTKGSSSTQTQSSHQQLQYSQQSQQSQQSLQSQQVNQPPINSQLQMKNAQELSAYQVKNGKGGIAETGEKTYHTSFINNAKQFHQQQQYILQQGQVNQNAEELLLSQKNLQRKQINKVSSCKSFEIRDKFSKTTTKSSNANNNVIINLSNVNSSNSAQGIPIQNLNNTAGNYTTTTVHNLSSQNLPAPNSSNVHTNNFNNNNSTINNSNNLINMSVSNKQNAINSSNSANYLPISQTKNSYSAALYQKSQNNILNKQSKSPPIENCVGSIVSSTNTAFLSNGGPPHPARNSSQNPPQSQNVSNISNAHLSSYISNHNATSNAKLAKKIDMYKVFNSTNSNSFSTQKDYQSSSIKQVKNLGLVLQKIIKNKTLKINEKTNQLNQHIQNSTAQNNIATPSPSNPNSSHSVKKSSTPGKKKISNPGTANSSLKSPQFISQLKVNSKAYL